MMGTRAMSGSAASRLRKARHGLLAVEHALVHVHVEDVRAALDLLAGDGEGGLVVAREDELGEARRAGDVGALADEQEAVGDGGFGHDVDGHVSRSGSGGKARKNEVGRE